MCPTRSPSRHRDRRAVSSVFQAILLVALVTVTLAGVGYVVLGLVLVDDDPSIKQVKLHVSESGVTVTPMIADDLPADDTEVRISRDSRDPTRFTVRDVAGASTAADVGPYVAVDGQRAASGATLVSAVDSSVGADAATPADAAWAAGQPVHVGTASGFIQRGDVLTIEVIDRENQLQLLAKRVRVTALPKTLLVDVDPSAGDEPEPVPPGSEDGPSGADRSETGGVVDLGDHWDLGRSGPSPPTGTTAVGSGTAAGGDGGGGCGPGCGDVFLPDLDLPGSPDGDPSGELPDASGGPGTGDGPGMVGGPGGEAGADMIDGSQGVGIMVTNGDGGDVVLSTSAGGTTTAISGQTFRAANGGKSRGTVPLSAFPQETQNRVGEGLNDFNNAKEETTFDGESATEASESGPESSNGDTDASGPNSAGEGANAGGSIFGGDGEVDFDFENPNIGPIGGSGSGNGGGDSDSGPIIEVDGNSLDISTIDVNNISI